MQWLLLQQAPHYSYTFGTRVSAFQFQVPVRHWVNNRSPSNQSTEIPNEPQGFGATAFGSKFPAFVPSLAETNKEMMRSSSASALPKRRGSVCISAVACRFLPSFTDLAFLLPFIALFWCTNGVGWLLTDSDTGWHIRTGDWVLLHRGIPRTDPFSFTRLGQTWIAWEWLWDVAMAVAHRLGGLGAVVLVCMLLLGVSSVTVYRNTLLASGHRFIAIVLTWIAMAASSVHWLARPHLVTPLMSSIFLGVLSDAERSGNARKLWTLPALTILWANLHAGFVVGLVLIAAYALTRAADPLFNRQLRVARIVPREYAVLILMCILAGLLNPYGLDLYVHITHYLGRSFYWGRISEFRSVDFHSPTAAYFESLLILAVASAAHHLKRRRTTHTLLLLSWSHLALFSVRNIPIFAAISAPSVGLAMKEWIDGAQTYWKDSWACGLRDAIVSFEADLRAMSANRKGVHMHAIPSIAVLAFAGILYHPGRSKTFVPEFDGSRFPMDAATFLSSRPQFSRMRLYSDWQWGGYLIYRLWPGLKVFNDGRTDFYGPEFVEEGSRVWEARPNWAETLTQYSVDAALVPTQSALATVLRERVDWELIYEDRVSVLFRKVETQRSVELSFPARATDRDEARDP